MNVPKTSDAEREQILLYDRLHEEWMRDSTLPERKDDIAISLRRLERLVCGPGEWNVLRDRMLALVAQEKSRLDIRPESAK
ncbi:MAG TPA: hypothetical protein VF438_02000 [Candidatus Paceibacterota bacterium]